MEAELGRAYDTCAGQENRKTWGILGVMSANGILHYIYRGQNCSPSGCKENNIQTGQKACYHAFD